VIFGTNPLADAGIWHARSLKSKGSKGLGVRRISLIVGECNLVGTGVNALWIVVDGANLECGADFNGLDASCENVTVAALC